MPALQDQPWRLRLGLLDKDSNPADGDTTWTSKRTCEAKATRGMTASQAPLRMSPHQGYLVYAIHFLDKATERRKGSVLAKDRPAGLRQKRVSKSPSPVSWSRCHPCQPRFNEPHSSSCPSTFNVFGVDGTLLMNSTENSTLCSQWYRSKERGSGREGWEFCETRVQRHS